MWSRKRESSLRATISAALPRGARMMGNWPARECGDQEREGQGQEIKAGKKGGRGQDQRDSANLSV